MSQIVSLIQSLQWVWENVAWLWRIFVLTDLPITNRLWWLHLCPGSAISVGSQSQWVSRKAGLLNNYREWCLLMSAIVYYWWLLLSTTDVCYCLLLSATVYYCCILLLSTAYYCCIQLYTILFWAHRKGWANESQHGLLSTASQYYYCWIIICSAVFCYSPQQLCITTVYVSVYQWWLLMYTVAEQEACFCWCI